MALSPADRYPSPRALADDLEHWLADEPVSAWPEPWTVRSRRWLGRHRSLVTAAAATIVVAVISLTIATFLLSAAKNAETQAKELAQKNETDAKNQAEKANRNLYLASMAQAHNAWNNLQSRNARIFLDQCPIAFRQWEWHYFQTLCQQADHAPWRWGSPVLSVAGTMERGLLAAALADGTVIVWSLEKNSEIFRKQFSPRTPARLNFVVEGRLLAVAEVSRTKNSFHTQVSILDLDDWQRPPQVISRGKDLINELAYCEKTRHLALGCMVDGKKKNNAVIIDAGTTPLREIRTIPLPTSGLPHLAWSPADDQLAVGGGDQFVYVLDPKDGAILTSLEAFPASSKTKGPAWGIVTIAGSTFPLISWGTHRLRYSPDGQFLAAALSNGQIRLWNARTSRLVQVFSFATAEQVTDLLFSKDVKSLISAFYGNHSLHVWDIAEKTKLHAYQGHQDRISGLAFLADGRLASSSLDKTIRVWNIGESQEKFLLEGHQRSVFALAFSPDGQTLVSGDGNQFWEAKAGTLKWWDLTTRRAEFSWTLDRGGVAAIAFDSKGSRFAAACGDGLIRLWSDPKQPPRILKGHKFAARSLAWSPDDAHLVSVEGSLAWPFLAGEAIVWDSKTGRERLRLQGHSAALSSVVYHPKGDWVATASADKTVRLWNAETGAVIKTLEGPSDAVLCLAVHPSGRWLAGGTGVLRDPDKPGSVFLWECETGKVHRIIKGHTQMVNGLAFSPDGRRLFSCARNDSVRIWETETARRILTLSPSDYSCSLRLSPDGRHLVLGNWEGRINLWRAQTYQPDSTRPMQLQKSDEP
jgi:WD40 repeat protein